MSGIGLPGALALLLAWGAFLALGIVTRRHYRARFGGDPSAATMRKGRIAGWTMLAASAVFAVLAQGWVFGPVLWCGAAMLGAALAFLALNWAEATGAGQ